MDNIEQMILEMDTGQELDLVVDGGNNMELFMSDPTLYGTGDYEKLKNLPKINGVTIVGDVPLSRIMNGEILVWSGMTAAERVGVGE